MFVIVHDRPAAAEVRAEALRQAIRDALGERTQKELAQATGLREETVSRLLMGKQAIQLEHLVVFEDALGVSARSLLTRAGYIKDDGRFDPDVLPVGGRRAIRAILREFGEGVDSVGDDGSHGP